MLKNERPTSNSYFDTVYGSRTMTVSENEVESGGDGTTLELENEGKLIYAIKMYHEDNLLVVKVAEGEDPLVYARDVTKAIGAEWVKERWIAAVLQHGVRRLKEELVFNLDIVGRGAVNIRFGDVLGLVSNYYGLRMGLNWRGIDKLYKALKEGLGGADEKRDWLDVRRAQDIAVGGPPARNFVPPPSVEQSCYLTVALTTCKRLELFKKTVESWGIGVEGGHGLGGGVCEVIVVDDSSSDEDRNEMKRLYPNFKFVWKEGTEDRGHAHSMNIIKNIASTRYLLYLEDDWEYIGKKGVGEVLGDAIEVLVGGKGGKAAGGRVAAKLAVYAQMNN